MATEMKRQREDPENAEAPLGYPFSGYYFGKANRITGAMEVGAELSQEEIKTDKLNPRVEVAIMNKPFPTSLDALEARKRRRRINAIASIYQRDCDEPEGDSMDVLRVNLSRTEINFDDLN